MKLRKYRQNSLLFRMKNNLRSRILAALKGDLALKRDRTMDLVGCTPRELKSHIETHFKPGMNWDNWGKGDGFWNLDHIRPCASFDLTDQEQQKACFHWSNLQPLWAQENLEKHAKWNPSSNQPPTQSVCDDTTSHRDVLPRLEFEQNVSHNILHNGLQPTSPSLTLQCNPDDFFDGI